MNLKDNIARMEQELASMKVKLKQQNKPKFKGGETITITSNSDTWEEEIVKIIATHYHFKSGGHLQLDRQDAQLKEHNKLELKGGDGWFIRTDKDVIGVYREEHHRDISRGAFRATKELAEIADKNMVTRNRLEAYVHQIQGDGDGMYYIYRGKTEYKCSNLAEIDILGTVMMQKETAEILCKALNKGEIEL